MTVCLVLRVLDVRRLLERLWWLLPPLNAGLLLLLVPFGNDDGTGNRSWLALPGGLFNLQPGEVVKVTFLLLLALQLQKQGEKGLNGPSRWFCCSPQLRRCAPWCTGCPGTLDRRCTWPSIW